MKKLNLEVKVPTSVAEVKSSVKNGAKRAVEKVRNGLSTGLVAMSVAAAVAGRVVAVKVEKPKAPRNGAQKEEKKEPAKQQA